MAAKSTTAGTPLYSKGIRIKVIIIKKEETTLKRLSKKIRLFEKLPPQIMSSWRGPYDLWRNFQCLDRINLREVLKNDTGGLERDLDVLGGVVNPVENLFNIR
jgi:hypothetical protein